MKFSDAFGTLSVKDPAFGALGNGVADDRAAIQACFDAAFGSTASPHGNSNRFTNRSVYFPSGNYLVGGPLYLTGVMGGKIFGSSRASTRLQYSGSYTGNTVAQGTLSGASIAIVQAVTPLIIMNGFAHSTFSDMTLSIDAGGANNSAGCYLFWNGSVDAGPTGNTWSNILFEGGTRGMLIGLEAPGLCSEQLFLNCSAVGCVHGFRNESQNALDNHFIGCGAASCTTAGFSIPYGFGYIYGASTAGNEVDVLTGQEPLLITGCRTESKNFVNAQGSDTVQTIICCSQSNNGLAGYFVSLGSVGSAVIEGCHQASSGSSDGVISGSTTGKVYLRNSEFSNTSYLSSYTGIVAELDIPVGLVSALPTAATKYKGLRAVVTDANSTTFLATAAGSGGNTVPVFCDGTNWKIG